MIGETLLNPSQADRLNSSLQTDRDAAYTEAFHLAAQGFQVAGNTRHQNSDHEAVDVPAARQITVNARGQQVVDNVVQPVLVNVTVMGLRKHAQDDLLLQLQELRYYRDDHLISDDVRFAS